MNVEETCARCGHTTPDCARCGRSWPLLGAMVGDRPYCHTYVERGPTCYERESRDARPLIDDLLGVDTPRQRD